MSIEIVILADFLRPSLDKTFNQSANLKWLYGIISPDLRTHGLSVSNTDEFLLNISYTDLYDQVYADVSGKSLLDKWAQFYEALPANPNFDHLAEELTNRLIVVFEPSRGIRQFFARHNLTFIEIGLHPLRFAGDLLLSARSNNDAINARLLTYNKSRNWQAQCWKTYPIGSPRDAVLRADHDQPLIFLAQTSYDSSIISGGKFFSLLEHEDIIRPAAQGKALYLKPHPLDMQSTSSRDWLQLFPQSVVIETNFYDLLQQDTDLNFLTISSGSGYEAELAGHQTKYLSPHARTLDDVYWQSSYTLGSDVWAPGFWTFALTGQAEAPDLSDGLMRDKLRTLIGQRWSKPLKARTPIDNSRLSGS